jgi:hypothetical protein
VRRLLPIFAAALVLAVPAAALARRGVDGAAKDPLVHAALGARAPRQCASVYISSVDRFWAAVFFNPASGWGPRCKSFHKAGWTVLHHTRGRWRIYQAGGGDACIAVHVPAAIRRDLQVPCYPLLP